MRLLPYVIFCVLVGTGVLLTTHFDPATIEAIANETTPIQKSFGFPNICVFFDTAPSKWVLPFVYCLFYASLNRSLVPAQCPACPGPPLSRQKSSLAR